MCHFLRLTMTGWIFLGLLPRGFFFFCAEKPAQVSPYMLNYIFSYYWAIVLYIFSGLVLYQMVLQGAGIRVSRLLSFRVSHFITFAQFLFSFFLSFPSFPSLSPPLFLTSSFPLLSTSPFSLLPPSLPFFSL